MSGLKSWLATLALLAGIGASAPAQGMVQGGWTSQFGDQALGGPAFVGITFGYGMPVIVAIRQSPRPSLRR